MNETSSKIKKQKRNKRKHRHDIEKEDKMEFCKIDEVSVESGHKIKKTKIKKKSRHRESEGEYVIKESSVENERYSIESALNRRKVSEIENGYEEAFNKKRKRKLHEREVSEITETQHAGASENIKKKSKKKKLESDIDMEKESNTEGTEAVKSSGEHSKKSVESIHVDGKEKKRHSKKKKHSNKSEEVMEIVKITEEDETSYTKKKKKKKDKKKDRGTDTEQEENNKPDKKQESNHQEKVEIINTGKLNTENTSQKNDKKSQGIGGCEKATENEGVKTGQWSSVELGDSERQSKFFRLLGGFKKGSDASQIQNKFSLGKKSVFSPTSNSLKKTGGKFAMNKNQENIYTKALENEYERALTMNINRGVGLGFEKPPEEGKKFYIDTKSSKSVKFDD